MEKRGDFRPGESKSDFDMSKTAEFADSKSFFVADENNKNKLKEPVKINIGPIHCTIETN